ncbi:MAG: chromosome segregation protein SMC [Tissierellales bacterium]|nr:chromosome segregation protein SMC [Tissierellales bacterium]
MNLKRLELKGFKSFADKTKIDFETGITGIVGPNGSGKSNISDAIKWVLGEQSAKSLRGSKMEDIIFNGTDKRKPLNYSEITMILDNSDGKFPLEYREVMVTRRVFRSGDSEYYLNKTACRLKDIKELFMDTGIGTDGYSIIGQGKIDEILSTKPEDRRKLFEEAAGIVKYKSRKTNAERKLNRTDENLLRARDIIFELEKQVEPLEKQSIKAEKYIKYKEQLRDKELSHYKKNYIKIEKNKEEIFDKLNDIENIRRELQEREKEKHEIYANDDLEKQQLEVVIEGLNDQIAETKEQLQKKEGLIELINEKIAVANRDLQRYKIENEDSEKNSEADKADISNLEVQIDSFEDEKKLCYEDILSKEEKLKEIKEDLDSKTTQKNEMSTQYVKFLNDLTAIETRETSYRNFEANIQSRIDDLENKMKSEKENQKQLSDDFDKIDDEFSIEKKNLDEVEEKREQIVFSKNKLENELIKKSDSIRETERKFDSLKSKYKILNEMKNRHEGYFLSVKKTLDYLDNNENLKVGFEGVVADLIQVPEKYETAIEMSIGGALQNLVTETEKSAKSILAEIKKNRLGRVTFMPLDAMKGKKVQLEDRLKRANGFMGIASELIDYDDKYKSVIEYILGRVIVFEKIDDALNFAKQTGYKFKLVTLEGDILNPGGSITGGSINNKKQAGLLGRNRELDLLKIDIKKARDRYDLLRDEYHLAVEQLEEQKIIVDDLSKLKNEKVLLLQKLENHKKHIDEKLKDQINRINQFSSELGGIHDEKDNSLRQLESMKNEAERIRVQKEKIEESMTALDIHIGELLKSENLLEHEISELKIRVASCAEKVTSRKNELNQIYSRIEKSKLQELERAKLIQKCGNNRSENEELLTKIKSEKEDQRNNLDAQNQKIVDVKNIKDDLKDKLAFIEKEIENIKSELENNQNKRHKLQIELEKKDLKLNAMEDKLFEDYEIRIEDLKKIELEEFDDLKLDDEVKKLKNKIKALGSINLESIEKYKEVKERYDFLKEQEHDLIEAKNSLEQVIEEMEVQMRIQFKDNLEVIRKNFSEIFLQLFGGGKADIVISEEEDILLSGIDIIAQPPGKKLQSILLLSGGEKALTAIALLFAILKMKPSPFCILDEIEAALDDANVCRFADYLNHYADQTQFIVITHRKGTMEAVDSLYGVTMEEKGVSKIVSVKLTEESINHFIQ